VVLSFVSSLLCMHPILYFTFAMNFLTIGDNGQMLPVHQCLRIMAGNDFEKCARAYTIFHYNSMNCGFETHEKFWKGRKFEVLMVPLKKALCSRSKQQVVVWVKAEVHMWNEYNMGPGDRFMKWTLKAKFTPDSTTTMGVGSLVYDPTNNNEAGKECAAVITQVDEIETDEGEKIMMCNLSLCHSNDSISERWELNELQPFDGILNFHVFKMNVQGGGVLSYNHAEKEAFTMKWLDPNPISLVTEDDYDGFQDGYWYFDPALVDFDVAELVKHDQVQQLRRDFLKRMEDNQTEMIVKAGIRRIILKESFERLKEGSTLDGCNMKPFEQLLLCTPYFMYPDVVLYYLDLHDGNRERFRKFDISEADEDGVPDLFDGDWIWCFLINSLARVGLHLRDDKEWLNDNSKGFAVVMQSDDLVAREEMLDITFININGFLGEWFEKVKEFRAAIWCYNHNLEYVQNDNLVNLLSNIGLAHKRMDNFLDAFKYYEEAIILGNATGTSQQIMRNLFDNANMLQQAVKDWFGTSGQLPS